MRTLKKTLAFVLVLAMVVSLGAMGASAAFTDTADSSYGEAISVMSGIGVIDGMTADTFDPAGSLTREQAAKIIAYMLLGPTNAKLISTATSQKFSDVAKDRWSAGYIEYCANLNIIAGVGDGKFDPSGILTTCAFAKMVLCALGYKADAEGLTGEGWAIKAASLSVSAGISDSRITMSSVTTCTREQACQIAFKALTAKEVTYTGGSTMTVNGITITTGAVRSYVDGSIDAGANYDGAVGDGKMQFCEEHFPKLKYSTATDLNGVTGHKWTLDGKPIGTVYTPAKLLASSSDGTAWADLTNATKATYIGFKPETTVDFSVNGDTAPLDATIQGYAATVGNVVNFYDTDNDSLYNSVSVIRKTVATLAAAPVVSTNAAGDKIVTISSLAMYSALAVNVSGYDDLAKGDVVLYWTSANGVTYIEKAESISGIVTGKSSVLGLKVDGAYHATSALSGASLGGYTADDYSSTYTFYLDNSGAIVKAVADTTSTVSNVAYITRMAYVAGSGLNDVDSTQAQLLSTDGTVNTVTIASIDGGTPVLVNGTLEYDDFKDAAGVAGNQVSIYDYSTHAWGGYAAATGTVAAAGLFKVATAAGADVKIYAGISATVATNAAAQALAGKFYFYSINPAGKYVMNSISIPVGYAIGALGDLKITSGKAPFDNVNVGNDSTIFIYGTAAPDGTMSYKVYTGVANAPSTAAAPDNASAYNQVVKTSAGVAKYVYVKVASTGLSSATSDLIFIADDGFSTEYEAGVTYYVKDAILNGTPTSIRVKSTDSDAKGLYLSSAKDANGIYTLVDKNGTEKLGISANAGSVLIAGGAGYVYNSDTKVYYISNTIPAVVTEMTGDGIALSAIDKIYVVAVSSVNDTAKTIYVMQGDEATVKPTTVTLAAGTSQAATVATGTLHSAVGSVTGFVSGSKDTVKISVEAATNTKLSSITINGAAYTADANYVIAATGTYTVKVYMTDSFSGAVYVYTYSFTVAA